MELCALRKGSEEMTTSEAKSKAVTLWGFTGIAYCLPELGPRYLVADQVNTSSSSWGVGKSWNQAFYRAQIREVCALE